MDNLVSPRGQRNTKDIKRKLFTCPFLFLFSKKRPPSLQSQKYLVHFITRLQNYGLSFTVTISGKMVITMLLVPSLSDVSRNFSMPLVLVEGDL